MGWHSRHLPLRCARRGHPGTEQVVGPRLGTYGLDQTAFELAFCSDSLSRSCLSLTFAASKKVAAVITIARKLRARTVWGSSFAYQMWPKGQAMREPMVPTHPRTTCATGGNLKDARGL